MNSISQKPNPSICRNFVKTSYAQIILMAMIIAGVIFLVIGITNGIATIALPYFWLGLVLLIIGISVQLFQSVCHWRYGGEK